jgi:hypothetical protein
MSCEHHWHDEGIWEFCCECNAHKCEAVQRVRELLPKWQEEAKEFQCACYGGVIKDLTKALDGDINGA